MSEIGQLSSQLGMKVAMQQLDAYLEKRGVDEAFIREHTVKLEPIRARVQSTVTLSKP